MLEDGDTRFYFADENQRGYINRLDFEVNGKNAVTEDHPQHQDIIKLMLPDPLIPGDSVSIKTPFHVKLPYLFSRSGYKGSSFQITQWYPKPAVFDMKGWHPMPYLSNGEYYSEFGSFDVQIDVPEKYIVAATGNLISSITNSGRTLLQYQELKIHDFAWFADSTYQIKKSVVEIQGNPIELSIYYHKKNEKNWDSAMTILKQTLEKRSEWIGAYPYKTVKVVESLDHSSGGMEYPTVTVISSPGSLAEAELLIGHEVGHNWFYGILGNNEREHPWMDEGMNSYYDNRFHIWRKKMVFDKSVKHNIKSLLPDNPSNLLMYTMMSIRKDQPINTPSDSFSLLNYAAIPYSKTAKWLEFIEEKLGQPAFDNMMKSYFEKWKFKHPQPENFKSVASTYLGSQTDSVFNLLDNTGYIQKPKRRGISVQPGFSLKNTETRNSLFLFPALGYNTYDGWMVGAVVHNYTLPVTKLRFVAVPMYSTNSHDFSFIGKLGYHFYGEKGSDFEIALSGSTFRMNSYTDSTGKENFMGFHKLVPTLRYTLANKYAKSSMKKYIQWKTFFITETGIRFQRDTILQKDIITYPKSNRYLNQLSLVVENSRALYPYNVSFVAEQSKQFVRLSLTANYFFNFAKGGGLDFRFFAGKFFYTTDNTVLTQFQTDRYHLNMSGPNGAEDYTYSNYFLGRNEFAYSTYDGSISGIKNFFRGLPVAQIMQRDGFFKVKTDLLSNKIGKTDNWLSAINISTTIPHSVNPLDLLPVKIPLKVFVDVGTYAEAWDKNNSNGRFLYDAGLQLSLLKNTINIYFPILYSKVYRNYFKSTLVEKKFMKTISFSIDLQNLALNKLFPFSPF